MLRRVTRLPTGKPAKSTTASQRSPGARPTASSRRGAPSRPPSLPTWTNQPPPAAPAGLQTQVVAAGVGGVEETEAVTDGGHLQHGPRRAVDELDVAQHPVGEALVATDGVAEGAVLLERPVAQHQRDVPVAAREREPVLLVVADEEEAGRPAPHLRGAEVHAVVVVPERRRPLRQRIHVTAAAHGRPAGAGARHAGVRRAYGLTRPPPTPRRAARGT
ncbi:hypothetical protein AC230_21840 [Streptomyces caatingaensis]|uniref:Uncharacterized protein n=1 Tax=Streptomyces caatingaensis TaxID=1678637 RepID=A0A0K9XAY5_9ACTN|nr:hypothetical protein AC230_21840 [Streptomyces caatingaensis]